MFTCYYDKFIWSLILYNCISIAIFSKQTHSFILQHPNSSSSSTSYIHQNDEVYSLLRKKGLHQRFQSSIDTERIKSSIHEETSNIKKWMNTIRKIRKKNDINIQEMFAEQIINEEENGKDNDDHNHSVKLIRIVSTELFDKDHHQVCNSNESIHRIEGCLIEKEEHHSDGVSTKQHEGLIHFFFNFNDTKASIDENLLDSFLAIIHRLYKHHLLVKGEDYETSSTSGNEYQFVIQLQDENKNNKTFNQELLSSVGFLILSNKGNIDEKDCTYQIDRLKFVNHLHEYSFIHRGTEQGRITLELIGILSNERNSFHFDRIITGNSNQNNGRNIISHQKQVIPSDTIDEINHIMTIIKNNGWLSTNPDSVDGLPSLHLNLITGGIPLFETDIKKEVLSSKEDLSFESAISYLTTLLRPYLYDQLLPVVKELSGSNTVEISDVFLRNYGSNVQPISYDDNFINNDDPNSNTLNNSRFGLSPHYDVFSSATCVIALDSTASSGRNGLYTIYCEEEDGNVAVSNHAAMKQFFPLQTGDGVIHSFDILHGVDVDPSLSCSRTSLIIWFVDNCAKDGHDKEMNGDKMDGDNVLDQPWLSQPHDHDHLKQFVLALASECKAEIKVNTDVELSCHNQIHELYIKSSMHGNAFALNSLAEICDDELLSENELTSARMVPKILNREDNPFVEANAVDEINQRDLAKALWFESSMRGNRVAQTSLAGLLTDEYFMSEQGIALDKHENQELLLFASTFFCLASQQGYEVAIDALSRIVRLEYLRLLGERTEEETGTIDEDAFSSQPFVQTALLSLQH